jgi:hypothetical protein
MADMPTASVLCPVCKVDGMHEHGCSRSVMYPVRVRFAVTPEETITEYIESARVFDRDIDNELPSTVLMQFKSKVLPTFTLARTLERAEDGTLTWAEISNDEERTLLTGFEITPKKSGMPQPNFASPAKSSTPNLTPNLSSVSPIAPGTNMTVDMFQQFVSSLSLQNSSHNMEAQDRADREKRKREQERDIPTFNVDEPGEDAHARACKFRDWKIKLELLTDHTNEERIRCVRAKVGYTVGNLIKSLGDEISLDFDKLMAALTDEYDVTHGLKAATCAMLAMFQSNKTLSQHHAELLRLLAAVKYTVQTEEIWILTQYINSLRLESMRKKLHAKMRHAITAGKKIRLIDLMTAAKDEESSSLAAKYVLEDGTNMVPGVCVSDLTGYAAPGAPSTPQTPAAGIAAASAEPSKRPVKNAIRFNNTPGRNGTPGRRRLVYDDNKNCIIHHTESHALVDCRARNDTQCTRCKAEVEVGQLGAHLRVCTAIRCFNCRKWGDHISTNCPEPKHERGTARKRGLDEGAAPATDAKKGKPTTE